MVMKQETNNEIDLLLRRLSRRQDFVAPGGGLPDNGDHLDADELSSYAENALPALTRASYTEHLADCARCRNLIAQLTASAGLISAPSTAKAAEPSAIRKFLASLFSPMVLRYAAPALGLIVVAVIGLVVFRQSEPGDTVAQFNEDTGQVGSAQKASTPESSGLRDNSSDNLQAPTIRSESQRDRLKDTQSRDTVAAAPAEASGAKTDKPASSPESQTVAGASVASAPVEGRVADEASKRTDDAAKKEAVTSPPPAPSNEVARTYEAAKTEDRREAPAVRPATGRTKSMERAMRSRDSQPEERDLAEAEVRSVGGRHFRKSRGIWIDTAYDSSRTTVNLTRGSEQYRALVADEPGIKNIADQLDGEVIVVWKGRAYRIR